MKIYAVYILVELPEKICTRRSHVFAKGSNKRFRYHSCQSQHGDTRIILSPRMIIQKKTKKISTKEKIPVLAKSCGFMDGEMHPSSKGCVPEFYW